VASFYGVRDGIEPWDVEIKVERAEQFSIFYFKKLLLRPIKVALAF